MLNPYLITFRRVADPPTDYIALRQLMRSGSIKVDFYLLPPQLLYVRVGQANPHIFAALEGVVVSAPKEEHVSEAKPLMKKLEKSDERQSNNEVTVK
jgi:hypothetical protein